MAAGVFIVLWRTITPADAAGFSIVKVNAAPPVIQLVSVSDGLVFLSEQTQVVAGIVIFKIGDEVPLTAILNNSMEGGT